MKNLFILIENKKRKPKAYNISKKKVQNFFVGLVVMYLIDWPCFFLIAVNLIVSLAIGRAISIEKKFAISFFGLSFW